MPLTCTMRNKYTVALWSSMGGAYAKIGREFNNLKTISEEVDHFICKKPQNFWANFAFMVRFSHSHPPTYHPNNVVLIEQIIHT